MLNGEHCKKKKGFDNSSVVLFILHVWIINRTNPLLPYDRIEHVESLETILAR
jgi:hypothetical protein